MRIEFHAVHKSFDAPVLAGVELEIGEGEKLSIVGPSGTGKSVLLKMTIGLIVPDQGDVLVGGQSVVAARRRELAEVRRHVGYVFQNAALFDSLTVFENVSMGLPMRELRTAAPREVERRVRRALYDVNLEPDAVASKLPAELSGGMRKRVGLARVIIGEPQVILYDEPVTGLDPVNAAAVSHLIAKLSRREGVTSVVVTHDVEGALELSDRVALLNHGRIAFVGTPAEFRQSDDPLVRAFAYREAAAEAALELMEEEEEEEEE